jgi:glutamyl-Q tRNA(Asp) synthetase
VAQSTYVGRFAPSPTGALHAGSLVAALASWLDARAHGGRWLVRIEDVDSPRCVAGIDQHILQQLASCGLQADAPPVWQSRRGVLYTRALERLREQGWIYPCGCSRKAIASALLALGQPAARNKELVYPGTCRHGVQGKPATAQRVRTTSSVDGDDELLIDWHDRRLGALQQNLTREVGDFVLRRADRLWTYQLAVVVDDAEQGISHVVRGEDLVDNTPRQIHLQKLLGYPTPHYLHTPLVLGANGEKLSKQNGAQALDTAQPLQALQAAARTLELNVQALPGDTLGDWLQRATLVWRDRWADPEFEAMA